MKKFFKTDVTILLINHNKKVLSFIHISIATKEFMARTCFFKIVCSFKTETLLPMGYFDRKRFSRFLIVYFEKILSNK